MDKLEMQNYTRLDLLLKEEGSKALREVFKRRYLLLTNTEWENGNKIPNTYLEKFSKKIMPSQTSVWMTMDLNKFDLTLLSSLIRCADDLAGKTMEVEFSTENSAIAELTAVRNILAHTTDTRVETKLFEELWDKIVKALMSLGADEDKIHEVFNSCCKSKGINFKSGQTAEEELKEVKSMVEEGDCGMEGNDYEKAITRFSSALGSQHLPKKMKLSILAKRSAALCLSLLSSKLPPKDEVDAKCKKALADAEEMLKIDQNCSLGYVLAGKVHTFKKDWKSAIQAFDRALDLDPSLTEALKHRDECRYEMSNLDGKYYLNPQYIGRSIEEDLSIFHEQRGFYTTNREAFLKENEEELKSSDVKRRAYASSIRGNLFQQGIDVQLDYEKAVGFYKEAVEGGDVLGMYFLGIMYMEGKGVAKDVEKAVELFERGAKSQGDNDNVREPGESTTGIAYAQFALGKCFDDGLGKPIDFKQAAEWYSRASGNGNGAAAHNLGFLYEAGRGVSQSSEKAKQYWRLAASRGIELSMDHLAWVFLNEGKPDIAEQWYNQSLERENIHSASENDKFRAALAQVRLATMERQKTKIQDADWSFVGFLPYTLTDKGRRICEAKIEEFNNHCRPERRSNETSSNANSLKQLQLTNPQRVQSVVRHRKKVQATSSAHCLNDFLSLEPKLQEVPENSGGFTSLVEITVSDMLTTKDQVYEGRVLNLTVTEDPLFLNAVHVIAKDENHDNLHIAIYDVEMATATNELCFGSQFSIKNPYFRIAMDGCLSIRVDDPRNVIFHSDMNKSICRFCWKENPEHTCAKCKRAEYCSKECQTQDWKLLKHKFICKR